MLYLGEALHLDCYRGAVGTDGMCGPIMALNKRHALWRCACCLSLILERGRRQPQLVLLHSHASTPPCQLES